MKKILLGLAGAGVVAAGVMPIVQSSNAEESYNGMLVEMNAWSQQNMLPIEFSKVKFEHGLTDAHAITRVVFNSPDADSACVDFASTFDFGPSAYIKSSFLTSKTTLISNPVESDCQWILNIPKDHEMSDLIASMLSGDGPLVLNASKKMSGDFSVDMITKPIEFITTIGGDNLDLSVHPITLKSSFNTGLDKFVSEMDWPGLALKLRDKNNKVFTLTGGQLSYDADQSKITEYIYSGTSNLTWKGLHLINEGKAADPFKNVTIEDINIVSTVASKNGKLGQTTSFSFNNVSLNDKASGSVELGINASNLDLAATNSLLGEMNQFMSATASDQRVLQQKMPQLIEMLLTAVSDAKIEVTPLRLSSKEHGDLEFSTHITAKNLVNFDLRYMRSPEYLSEFFTADASAKIDEKLLGTIVQLSLENKQSKPGIRVYSSNQQESKSMIENMEQLGFIRKSGSTYESKVRWSKDGLKLNGHNIPLS